MKFVRFRIDQLMLWVAVLAANLAVCRELYEPNLELLAIALPPLVVFQAAAVRQKKAKGRKRAFWLGFVAGGGLASIHLVGTFYACEPANRPCNTIWLVYAFAVWTPGTPLFGSAIANAVSGIPFVAEIAIAALFFVPVLLIAGLSGLAARWAYDRWNRPMALPAETPGEH